MIQARGLVSEIVSALRMLGLSFLIGSFLIALPGLFDLLVIRFLRSIR